MNDRGESRFAPAPARPGAGRFTTCLIAVWLSGGAFLVITASAPREGAPYDRRGGPYGPPTVAAAYADGAPPGFSGGFKEQSCHACHFDAEPNTPPGEVTLTGVPERFVGGQQYSLTVALTRPGMKLGGFQLAARFEDGAQAGTLTRGTGEEKRMAIQVEGNVHYANQRRPGADPVSPDTATWMLIWTAPADARPVTFHVAANAADNDESARGDYVYTTTAVTRPR